MLRGAVERLHHPARARVARLGGYRWLGSQRQGDLWSWGFPADVLDRPVGPGYRTVDAGSPLGGRGQGDQ